MIHRILKGKRCEVRVSEKKDNDDAIGAVAYSGNSHNSLCGYRAGAACDVDVFRGVCGFDAAADSMRADRSAFICRRTAPLSKKQKGKTPKQSVVCAILYGHMCGFAGKLF